MFIRFWKDEEGLGTLEILMIVAVLVIGAIAFRRWILKWISDFFQKADTEVTSQTGTMNSDASKISPAQQ